MGLEEIDRNAVLNAVEEYRELGEEAFLEKYGFGAARDYFLEIDNERFPSKAILGVAHKFTGAGKEPMRAQDFSGGEARTARKLENLGFHIIKLSGRNPAWTRDELLLALDHYLRHPGDSHDPSKAEIVALTETIGQVAQALGLTGDERLRNANGVSMKLLNFRAHDPAYRARGRKGLERGNRLEKVVWDEFAHRPEYLRKTVEGITRNLPHQQGTHPQQEPDEGEALEGRLLTRLHRYRERDRDLVKRKKAHFKKQNGRLFCEACNFDFRSTYGERGANFMECHHLKPVSELVSGETTKLSDLAMLCANCHRMIHAARPWWTLEELRSALSKEA